MFDLIVRQGIVDGRATDIGVTDGLIEAVAATGVKPRRLPSGAGHDTVTLARMTDTAMLFVRCAGGISHHPDESVEEADVALAIEAATRFARALHPAEVAR